MSIPRIPRLSGKCAAKEGRGWPAEEETAAVVAGWSCWQGGRRLKAEGRNMCKTGLHVALLLLLALNCIIMQCVGVLLAGCGLSDLHIYAATNARVQCGSADITHAPCKPAR